MANSNKNKKYHFIYKTSCLFNSNYYIGMHSTSNILDGYMGSGKRIQRAIKKYGVEHFKCDILEYLSDRDSLAKREKEIVTEELINDVNCLNLKPGGFGGFKNDVHQQTACKAGGIATSKRLKEDSKFSKDRNNKLSKSKIKGWKEGKYTNYLPSWTGKTHTKETKLLMSLDKKKKYLGKNNPSFGSFWITNGTESKKVKKDSNIPNGWYKGRKI